MSKDFEDLFADNDNDDLFGSDDDFNLDQPSFDQDSFDLPDIEETEEDEGGGPSRTFVIIGVLLAFVFVIIMAIVAALLLGGSDECNENCRQATEISGTNAAVNTQIAASSTALMIESTAQAGTEVAAGATATDVAIRQATATQGAVNTAVAATQTAISRDATATQAQDFVQRTQTAIASITPTVAATAPPITGELRDPVTGAPGAGIQLCVFLDDGDGIFEPTDPGTGDCANVIELFGQGGGVAVTPAGSGGQFTATPAATQPAPTGQGTPILQPTGTATQGSGAGGPPSPTAEDLGSGALPNTALGRTRPQNFYFQPPSPTPEALDEDTGTTVPAAQPTTAAATTAPTQGAAATTQPTAGAGTTGQGAATQAATQRPTTGANTNSLQPQATGTQGAGTSATAVQAITTTPSAGNPTTSAPAAGGTPTQEGGGGDTLVLQPVTNAQGQFVLSGLPPGQYFVVVGDETVPLNVIQSSQPQLFNVTTSGGETVTFLVEGIGGVTLAGTPTVTIDAAFLQTQTAIASATFGVGGPLAATGSATVDPAMPTTGLFTGEGDDVTGTDLIILALAGAVLVSIVVAARRMRSTI